MLIVSIVVVTVLVVVSSILGRVHLFGMSASQQQLFAQTTYFIIMALLGVQQFEMMAKLVVWQVAFV